MMDSQRDLRDLFAQPHATPKTKKKVGRPELTPEQKEKKREKKAADKVKTQEARKTDQYWVYGVTISIVTVEFKDDQKRPPEIKNADELVVMKVGQCKGHNLFRRFSKIEAAWSARCSVLPAAGLACENFRLDLKTGAETKTSAQIVSLLRRAMRKPDESDDVVFAIRVDGKDKADSLEKYGMNDALCVLIDIQLGPCLVLQFAEKRSLTTSKFGTSTWRTTNSLVRSHVNFCDPG